MVTVIGSTIKKNPLNHASGRDVMNDYAGHTDIDDLKEPLNKIESNIILFVKKHKY